MGGDLGEYLDPAASEVRFVSRDRDHGLRIVDPIERRTYDLRTPAGGELTPIDAEEFPVPVDAAVGLTTSTVSLQDREAVYIRDTSGRLVEQSLDAAVQCDPKEYLIDITASVKVYLQFDSAVSVSQRPSGTRIDFDGETPVTIAARSPHRRPRETITATKRLDDLRAAVSAFSSALQTTGPERSYPNHRGHPPRIEFGEELSISSTIERPTTDVTISVPRSLADLYVVAPLAFYLGADLEWGPPHLRTGAGFEYDLEHSDGFPAAVETLLKHVFVLDCVTRTEGLYPVAVSERDAFERRTRNRYDVGKWYDQPIAERLRSYLEVPVSTVRDLVPTWGTEAYVEPVAESAPALPYLVDMLATVRTSGQRAVADAPSDGGPTTGLVRSADAIEHPIDGTPHLELPESPEAMSTVWVGEGLPVGGAKALVQGFEHRLNREPVEGDIRIRVIANGEEMQDERDTVREVYASRSDRAVAVDVESDLTTDEFRATLATDTDLLHYIGHVDERGFRCRDGYIDARECSTVGTDVFLLNSCRSYEQGERLVEAGAIAGIVTLTDLLNHRAARIGRTLGSYLNHGFPLYAALEVIRSEYRFGTAYALLGDPQMLLAQPTTTFPEYLDLETLRSATASVTHRTFPSHWAGMGTLFRPPYEDSDEHSLFGGDVATLDLPRSDLVELLDRKMPLRDGADLRFEIEAGSDERS